MSRTEIRNRIYPYNGQLLHWGYTYVARSVAAHNATPVWVYLPALSDEPASMEVSKLKQEASKCGFQTLSLEDVYAGQVKSRLKISADDAHPNALGHALIADKLFLSITQSKWFTDRVDTTR